MHEIRATIPPDCVSEAARLAHAVGVEAVAVTEVFIHGPNQNRSVVSIETSTPRARAFVDAILTSPKFSAIEYTLTSRELRAIVSKDSIGELTQPMREPFPDVIQDLWQLSHITPSYLGRAAGGAILLATGIVENSPIAIVVAALILPFLSQVLAISFGIWSRDARLRRQGVLAILTSTALALAAGAAVAWIEGGPIRFHDFKDPLPSFCISAVIGIAAGLSSADDAGRRYLIGVAAAVQFAIFPVWFGAALILGIHDSGIATKLLTFAINLVTISGTAALSYAILHLRKD
jgi:hypothetical protein